MDAREQAAWGGGVVRALREEIGRAIVGHEEVVHDVLVCLFCGGHALLEGVPGLGKTTLIKCLGQVLDLAASRIQFTPDLMPADIIGTNVLVPEETQAAGAGAESATLRAVPEGTGVRQHRAGGRDQPRHAQDPVRAPGGDAGADGDRGRDEPPAGSALHRAGHPEPHRDGGHLPSSGGAARPFLLQALPGLPVRGGDLHHHRPHHGGNRRPP